MSVLTHLLAIGLLTVALLARSGSAMKQNQGKACEVMFNGRMLSFQKCAKIGSSGIQVFWSVWWKVRKIDTLVRSNHDGYIAFGWGYNQMIGSQAQVIFLGKKWMNQMSKPYPYIRLFNLKNKFPAAVTPAGMVRAAEYKDGFLAARWVQPWSTLVKPGKLNPAIWSKGARPTSNYQLMRHFARGVVMLKV